MPNVTYSSKMAVINILINKGGAFGIILAYIIMVMRRTDIVLPIFRGVAILDIKAGLIYNKKDIKNECKKIIIKRFHIPSIKIIRELIQAYKEYVGKIEDLKIKNISINQYINEKEYSEKKLNLNVGERAILNRDYLIWMFYYYFYRSIFYSNLKLINESIKGVVTIEEYTPQIAGYLSVLNELDKPLYLFLHGKLFIPELTLHSLKIYDRVIYSPGVDTDILNQYNNKIYREKIEIRNVKLNLNYPPKVGLFLSSYYELNNYKLLNFFKSNIIPLVKKMKKQWGIEDILIYCHPNDKRPHKILVNSHIIRDEMEIKKMNRMTNLDLVVVGNSSVAEEALKMGVPVVYSNELDTYTYDIYGYINYELVIDGSLNLPTLQNIYDFYESFRTKRNLTSFFNSKNNHETVEFIDAIKL